MGESVRHKWVKNENNNHCVNQTTGRCHRFERGAFSDGFVLTLFAVYALPTGSAVAGVSGHVVFARGAVLARGAGTFVNICKEKNRLKSTPF
ncbi:hypothetical protein DPMN_140700 [Dreissena polymorpha]|uniref:Uncharacterized protein n=1 Tax=Dreissena polymorpha TaxID=45954 RepID=A0A9D4G837_DREPO|nr:hypothetical protein DPMN_140700 [Dreissena polymorpha]